jgi:hypothetical protein
MLHSEMNLLMEKAWLEGATLSTSENQLVRNESIVDHIHYQSSQKLVVSFPVKHRVPNLWEITFSYCTFGKLRFSCNIMLP